MTLLLDTPLADMTVPERRDLLATLANPGERYDYMVVLEGSFIIKGATKDAIEGSDHRVEAALHYVADRRLLTLDAFSAYLDGLDGGIWSSLEAVALLMLSDVNNELIPRWAQIRLTAGPGSQGKRHSVIIDDRQPGWDNPTLLARHGMA